MHDHGREVAPSGPVRRGRVSPEEQARRRELLLDTAFDEFVTHGFMEANLDRIAKRCRISKMTIYRQIGDKERLFSLATETVANSLKREVLEATQSGGSLSEVVATYVEIFKRSSNARDYAILRLAIAESKRFPWLALEMLRRIGGISEPMAEYLHKESQGRVSLDKARRQALVLQSMAVGGFLKLLGATAPDTEEWSNDVCELFLQGFGVDPTRWRQPGEGAG